MSIFPYLLRSIAPNTLGTLLFLPDYFQENKHALSFLILRTDNQIPFYLVSSYYPPGTVAFWYILQQTLKQSCPYLWLSVHLILSLFNSLQSCFVFYHFTEIVVKFMSDFPLLNPNDGQFPLLFALKLPEALNASLFSFWTTYYNLASSSSYFYAFFPNSLITFFPTSLITFCQPLFQFFSKLWCLITGIPRASSLLSWHITFWHLMYLCKCHLHTEHT